MFHMIPIILMCFLLRNFYFYSSARYAYTFFSICWIRNIVNIKYCREYVSVIIQSRLYRWMRTVKGIHYVQRINRFLICLYTCSPNFIVVSLKWTKLRQSLWIDVHQLGWPTEPNSCLNLERNLVLYVSSLKLYLSIPYIFKYSWN